MSGKKSLPKQIARVQLAREDSGLGGISAVLPTADNGFLVLIGGKRLRKYDSANRLVTRFGAGGRLELPGGNIILQKSHFLLVRIISGNQSPSMSVSRYDATTGVRDNTFGKGGNFDYPFEYQQYTTGSVWASYDETRDKLYLVLHTQFPTRILVIRVTAGGQLDTTYGRSGRVELMVPWITQLSHVHVRNTGHLLVGFIHGSGAENGLEFHQFNLKGERDAAFGVGGRVTRTIRGLTSIFMDDSEGLKYLVGAPESIIYGLTITGDDDPSFAPVKIHGDWGAHALWGSPISYGTGQNYRILHVSRQPYPGLPRDPNAVYQSGPEDIADRPQAFHSFGDEPNDISAKISRAPRAPDFFVALSNSIYRYRY